MNGSPDYLTHEKVSTNGIQLHVVQAGPLDGKPVLLLHGFPEFWYGWRHQITPLAQAGFRVIVPDQRGYNLSDKPQSVKDYSIDRLARDITGLIDGLGYDRVFLAGHDWGAAVAWHVAATAPERLEKLVILNVPHPAVMMGTLRSGLRQVLKSWYIFFFQMRGLSEWLLSRRDYDGLLNMLKASAQPGTFNADNLEQYRNAYRQPGALTAMLNWYRAAFHAGIRRTKNPAEITPERINVPTLILWGVKDVALSHEMAQPSADLCVQSELVFFDRATHWVQHDEAEAVTHKMINFFSTSN